MNFDVTDFVGVLRSVEKTYADVVRVSFNFSGWLRDTEVLASAGDFDLTLGTPASGTWQLVPYTVPQPSPPADTTPLVLSGTEIIDGGKTLDVLLSAGTPGVGYVASLVATTDGGRRKELNFFVAVDDFRLGTPMPPTIVETTVVSSTIALAEGVSGTVFVSNNTGGAITITLPPTAVSGWTIDATDILGNAHAFDINWQGAGGALIAGQATYTFTQDNQSATFRWNGTGWSVF